MATSIPLQEVAACTCLRLRKAARRVTQLYDQALAPADLTITQFSLMAHLLPGQGLTMGALAEALVMDPTTLTRNLRPLQARGLVAVAPGTEDRRQRLIRLTDAGRALLADAYPLWRAAQAGLAERLGGQAADLDTALTGALARLNRP